MIRAVHRASRTAIAAVVGIGLGVSSLVGISAAVPASAAGTGVVINEAYLKGGSAGAPFNKKFVELYNPGASAVSLSGWSLQYRSASGTAAPSGTAALSGSIAAGGYFLVQLNGNGSTGSALPTPDLDLGGTINPSGTTGTLYLARTATAVTLPTGSVTGNTNVVDLLGYGASNTFEGTVAPVTGANGVPNSLARTGFADTDNNAADFSNASTVTPQNSSTTTTLPVDPSPTPTPTVSPEPTPTPTPTAPAGDITPIAAIQGTGSASPLAGQTVTTEGVVTATYPTGGFQGYYVQTKDTGGALDLSTHTASDAIFVFSASTVGSVALGDTVRLTGAVSEFNGLTELTVSSAAGLTKPGTGSVQPVTVALPRDEAQRESLEGMLLAPQGDYTVSNTYSTNQYAEIGLAAGTTPLITPTEIARPGTPQYTAAVADNAARAVTLDDGASLNFLSSANQGTALPYLSNTTVSVGAKATFTSPVVFDYRNNTWKFQPTTQLTAATFATVAPAGFSAVREAHPKDVGGDIQIAGFNVLNYFTTTGDELSGCTFYKDRSGANITVNSGCDARGAANAASLARQQAKIVKAINTLGAEVVSLEEIENSARFGKSRDDALATLTAALNTAAGSDVWAFVPSPEALPASEDVIRTAFIYKKASVEAIGSSQILLSGSAFDNARRPLAQEFRPVGGNADSEFIAIANHFKSKGSGSGADADQNDGQGASNASRVAQANDLIAFSSSLQSSLGTDKVFLLGDFNAYSQEDPAVALTNAGYVDQGSKSGKWSYSFSGQSGSLDHIYASPAANAIVSGTDIWNINSGESIALEYSRYNYNATNFYTDDVYRSSDHDPVVVGLAFDHEVDINLLDINDFHGRIDANTVKFAGTIEQLKAAHGEANSLFLSTGDNIGASLYESSSQQDQPTIDVLNALGLRTSAVGNHEFDGGFDDLKNRVIAGDANHAKAAFDYLGANVYLKGTTTPALAEYTLVDVAGVTVGVIGTVTEETPSLVSPGGIAGLDFGDPVAATNRVAAQLSDGDPSNGEADVLVAAYHEGAGAGTPDGATLEQEIATDTAFARIVKNTSAEVDAIFTGHTHKQYSWNAPVPGVAGTTRPVLQTGSYGENIGNVVLTVDGRNGDVLSYTAKNVARTTVADSTLTAAYPRVAQVKSITDAAIAQAKVIGGVQTGSVVSDITTAFGGGSYGPNGYTAASGPLGTGRDDRASESTLGNKVADSLVSTLSSPAYGGATIGVVNPGGLRNELYYAPDGVITKAEANAVLPFANNLWTTSLTGAQFKTVLEQQWQRNANGTVPSRPFLKLGLSSNVQYTFDATRPEGDRITGVWIDGAKLDPARSYRVGSFNFLLTGGDNFREFTKGTNTKDSGLVDRDAWFAYLDANRGLAPSFARGAVQVTGAPTAVAAPGSTVSFQVSGLNLTSLGSPLNTSLTASWSGTSGGFAPIAVTNGAASVSLQVPANAPVDSLITLMAQPSGTVVRVPVAVTPDTTAPTVSHVIEGRVLYLTATDAASGVKSIEYALDGSTGWTAYSTAVTLDGNGHTIRYRATDVAGNVSGVRSTSIATVAPVGPAALQVQGSARTVQPGTAVTGLGVRVVDSGSAPVAGVSVRFALTGPGIFAGGSTTADVVADASGYAFAPAITGSAAGTVTVQANLASASPVALPSITVVAPSSTLTATSTASTAVEGGKVTVTVSATNTSGVATTILLKTKYGTKTFTTVAPGATVTQTFKSYLASIPAGSATVTVSTADQQRSTTADYAARSAN